MTVRRGTAQTLLLDTDLTWNTPQRQALALALALRREGLFQPLICCPPASALAEAALKESLPLVPLPLFRSGRVRGLCALLRLWLRQSRHTPLLLHSFSSEALLLAARLERLRRRGSTLRMHSCFALPAAPLPSFAAMPTRALRAWQDTARMLCADAVLLHALADATDGAGLEPARMAVVHPGLDTAALPARAPRGDGRFVFVALASLQAGVGLDILIKAMAALWQRSDLAPWEVRVAGGGPLFAALLDEARALGVESRLALLGPQDAAEVLPRCDAMVAPATDRHGNMEAVASAWCAGLPLICSKVAAHAELVHAGRDALVVPAGDPQDLAAAMIRLMREEALSARLAAAGREMISYVGLERMTRQCLNLYTDCVKRLGWVLSPAAPSTPAQEFSEHHEV